MIITIHTFDVSLDENDLYVLRFSGKELSGEIMCRYSILGNGRCVKYIFDIWNFLLFTKILLWDHEARRGHWKLAIPIILAETWSDYIFACTYVRSTAINKEYIHAIGKFTLGWVGPLIVSGIQKCGAPLCLGQVSAYWVVSSGASRPILFYGQFFNIFFYSSISKIWRWGFLVHLCWSTFAKQVAFLEPRSSKEGSCALMQKLSTLLTIFALVRQVRQKWRSYCTRTVTILHEEEIFSLFWLLFAWNVSYVSFFLSFFLFEMPACAPSGVVVRKWECDTL